MSMTSVFCDVDDCLIFEPQWHKQLICNDKKSPVISKLTLSEDHHYLLSERLPGFQALLPEPHCPA